MLCVFPKATYLVLFLCRLDSCGRQQKENAGKLTFGTTEHNLVLPRALDLAALVPEAAQVLWGLCNNSVLCLSQN